MRKMIVNNTIELKNKLHSQLTHHYPNYNKIFVNIDSMTSLNSCNGKTYQYYLQNVKNNTEFYMPKEEEEKQKQKQKTPKIIL